MIEIYVLWIVLAGILFLPMLFEFGRIYRYGYILLVCLTIGYSLTRELDLYSKPIQAVPTLNVDFSYNHHKMVLKENQQIDIIVWLSRDSKEFLYEFPFTEQTKELKKQLDALKKAGEEGNPTDHEYGVSSTGTYFVKIKPSEVRLPEKNP